MKHYIPTFTALTFSLIGGVLTPAVKAGQWDKQMNITTNRPIEVQDTVLPAGSYVIKLAALSSERRVVEIFDAEETHLITTVLAIPAYRLEATVNGEFQFYKSEDGRPPVLRSWFYPGDSSGLGFRPGRGAKTVESAQTSTNDTKSSVGGN